MKLFWYLLIWAYGMGVMERLKRLKRESILVLLLVGVSLGLVILLVKSIQNLKSYCIRYKFWIKIVVFVEYEFTMYTTNEIYMLCLKNQ